MSQGAINNTISIPFPRVGEGYGIGVAMGNNPANMVDPDGMFSIRSWESQYMYRKNHMDHNQKGGHLGGMNEIYFRFDSEPSLGPVINFDPLFDFSVAMFEQACTAALLEMRVLQEQRQKDAEYKNSLVGHDPNWKGDGVVYGHMAPPLEDDPPKSDKKRASGDAFIPGPYDDSSQLIQ